MKAFIAECENEFTEKYVAMFPPDVLAVLYSLSLLFSGWWCLSL